MVTIVFPKTNADFDTIHLFVLFTTEQELRKKMRPKITTNNLFITNSLHEIGLLQYGQILNLKDNLYSLCGPKKFFR